jgi:hypothetical protein
MKKLSLLMMGLLFLFAGVMSVTAAPNITATLTATPDVYAGKCPAVITFNGQISSSEPGRVQYKFLRSDNANAPVQTLNFEKAGTMAVSTTWTLGGAALPTYAGWEAIQVVYPQQVQSNKAQFKMQCQQASQLKINARLAANPQSFSGNCPAVIKFDGEIFVSAPCTVQYKFLRSDGGIDTIMKTLTFEGPGSKPVSTTWTLGGAGLPSYAGWEAIEVSAPQHAVSNKAAFKMQCAGAATGGQPQQPVAVNEDCVSFNPATTAVQQISNDWKIVDGSHWMFSFGTNKAEADKALAIIKHYRMNESCFVGRPDPSFSYLKVGGAAPVGAFAGEDCLAFNPATIEVKQISGDWKIVDGSHWMFSFGAKKAEAEQSLAIIKKYGFTHTCYVGRPGPSFKYLRK